MYLTLAFNASQGFHSPPGGHFRRGVWDDLFLKQTSCSPPLKITILLVLFQQIRENKVKPTKHNPNIELEIFISFTVLLKI